jgi:hypothetical protein
MRPITIANIIDANKTSAELLCNSDHFGQDTFVTSSSTEPCIKFTSFFIITFLCTGGEIRTPISGFGDRHSTLELHP